MSGNGYVGWRPRLRRDGRELEIFQLERLAFLLFLISYENFVTTHAQVPIPYH